MKGAPQRKPPRLQEECTRSIQVFILKRFADGCRNATQIHKEISEQSYPGAYKNVWCIIQYLKKCEGERSLCQAGWR